MKDYRLLCAQPGTDPSIQTVLVSETPGPDRLYVPPSDGRRPISIDVGFSGGVQDDATDGIMGGLIAAPRGIVPAGYIAHLYLMTMHVVFTAAGPGASPSITGKLFVDGVSAAASWAALTVTPSIAEHLMISAVPLAAHYVIDATAALKYFDVRYDSADLGETPECELHVMGHMYRVA